MLRFRARANEGARWAFWIFLLSILMASCPAFAKSKNKKQQQQQQKRAAATATPKSNEISLTNIPLVPGHEAKGLVLPDFDNQGNLRGRFEAGTARRIDDGHIGFENLKITTYTLEKQPDLEVDMRTSVLDLNTRILSSQERSTVKRADFNIVGDSVQFDTNAKTGHLVGNVKMVITSQSPLINKKE
jgi:hypothetical protein